MSSSLFVPLARIVKPHGLKGEVKIALQPDVDLIAGTRCWIVPPVLSSKEFIIEAVRGARSSLIVKLSGVDTLDAADALRERTLITLAEDVVQIPGVQSEEDVLGLSVHDVTRGPLGLVVDVIHTGANDVWVVEHGPYGQVLIPAVDSMVREIDRTRRCITVSLLDGLIDEQEFNNAV